MTAEVPFIRTTEYARDLQADDLISIRGLSGWHTLLHNARTPDAVTRNVTLTFYDGFTVLVHEATNVPVFRRGEVSQPSLSDTERKAEWIAGWQAAQERSLSGEEAYARFH